MAIGSGVRRTGYAGIGPARWAPDVPLG